MPSPLIGVTTYAFKNQAGYTQSAASVAYNLAVEQAGGLPLMIPLGLSENSLETLFDRLDGILFTGGGDVAPQRYGSQPHRLVDGVDDERDRAEIRLTQRATKSNKPFLGICRGLQVVNVALGGSLYEDLVDQRPGTQRHQFYGEFTREYLAHPVEIEEASRLHSILGERKVEVNSLHHQGIRELASDLTATAFAPDGVIEAWEITNLRFAMAVQWHPENLQEHASMRALFREFVKACRQP